MSHGGDLYDKSIRYDFSVNLNPLGTPLPVREAIEKSMEHIHEYPDMQQRKLRTALSASEGCGSGEVLGGSGASELFCGIAQMIRPEKALLIAPCFSGYRHALGMIRGCETGSIPETDMAGLPAVIDASVDIVFIADPNNPTGRNIDKALLKEIADRCEETGTCLVVDECFLPLSGHSESLSSLAVQRKNLFVVKAFTKTLAIPGIRIGYVISSEKNIRELKRFLPEWNLSIPATEAGIACAEIARDTDFLERSYSLIKTEREYLEVELSRRGFEVVPSDANFILFRGSGDLYEKLLEKGILIRDCSDFEGLDKGWYRIAVKDHAANINLIDAIGRLIIS